MESRGILICGSGAGMAIVADKFPGVRAVLASSGDQAYDARRDDDVNVLALAANFTGLEDAVKIVQAFLSTPTGTADRYKRRLQKIVAIEGGLYR
jgi:ribose 5-phosphate isomerase B